MHIVQRDGRQWAEPCPCRIQRRAARRIEQARIPRRYQDCVFESFETMHIGANSSISKSLFFARKFVEVFPHETGSKGLLFVGTNGIGKTHLAVSILKTLILEKGATGVFWEHKELLDKLRSIYSMRVAGAEEKLLHFVTNCDVLVLDDLGDITPSDWSWDTTSFILNSRYNENRCTIITTNLENRGISAPKGEDETREAFELRRVMSVGTLGDRIGERMRSRLQEMCVVVEMQGEDFRQKVKRASFT